MRSPLLVLALVLAGAAPAQAQGLTAGVKGGVTFTDLVFENDVPTTRRAGLTAGGFVTVPVFGWLAVQPEVLYATRGADFDDTPFPTSVRLDYLEVPILLRVPLGARLHVVAGPSFAYRLRARSRTTFSGATEELDLDDDIERTDLGIAAGVGVEIRRLVVEARYTHGLRDIDAGSDGGAAIRNRAFALLAGIRF